jgi:hypothetical protein
MIVMTFAFELGNVKVSPESRPSRQAGGRWFEPSITETSRRRRNGSTVARDRVRLMGVRSAADRARAALSPAA